MLGAGWGVLPGGLRGCVQSPPTRTPTAATMWPPLLWKLGQKLAQAPPMWGAKSPSSSSPGRMEMAVGMLQQVHNQPHILVSTVQRLVMSCFPS